MSPERAGSDDPAPGVVDVSGDLLEVRDQGLRGTCLVFATTTGHEHARFRRRAAPPLSLSVELLFWRCKQLDGAMADDGTSFSAARDALVGPGQPPESAWPYDAGRDHRAPDYSPPPEALDESGLRHATLRPLTADTEAICQELRDGRVVVVGLELWAGFYDCNGASLAAPEDDLDGAGHAVCLVAIDDDRGAVKIRNSWGAHWGEGGYAWLATDGLRDVVWEAWIADDDVDDDDDDD